MKASARYVAPLERVLYLRSLPTIGDASLEELGSLAQLLEERRYKKGDVVIREDRPVDAIHLVTEGRIEVRWRGRRIAMIEAPYGAGFLGLLSGEPSGTLALADTDCRTLSVDAETWLELLEDNFSMISAGLRQISRQFVAARRKLPVSDVPPPMVLEEFGYPEKPFDLVERLVWLHETSAVFKDCNLDALAEICRHQTELRVGPGETLFSEGDPSDWGFSIIYGNVRYTDAETGTVRRAGAGFSLGYPDCLANQPRTYTVVTETDCVILKGTRVALLDVLEDNHHVALQLVGQLSSSLLTIYAEYGPI